MLFGVNMQLLAVFLALIWIVPGTFGQDNMTVQSILASREDLSIFTTLLKLSGIETEFIQDQTINKTLLAPTNDCFDDLPETMNLELLQTSPYLTHLRDLLKYHLPSITSIITSQDLEKSDTIYTTLSEGMSSNFLNQFQRDREGVLFFRDETLRRINITEEDLLAHDGAVHVIDSIAFPTSFGDTVDMAADYFFIRISYNLLVSTGLTSLLAEPGPWTWLAPADSALEALPTESLAFLQDPSNNETIRQLLKAHIIPGLYASNFYQSNTTLTSLSGHTLIVTDDNFQDRWAPYINKTTELNTINHKLARNGVVSSLSGILLPSDIDIPGMEQPTEIPNTASPTSSPSGTTETSSPIPLPSPPLQSASPSRISASPSMEVSAMSDDPSSYTNDEIMSPTSKSSTISIRSSNVATALVLLLCFAFVP